MDIIERHLTYYDGDILNELRETISTLNLSKTLKSNKDFIGRYSMSHDESMIVIWKYKGMEIWDLEDGECIKSMKIDQDLQYCSFSHNGKYIVSCTRNNIKLWLVETGKCLKTISIKGKTITTSMCCSDSEECHECTFEEFDICAFSPDGRTIITCSLNDEMKYWDIETATYIKTVREFGFYCKNIFSRDMKINVACQDDGLILTWNMENEKHISEAYATKHSEVTLSNNSRMMAIIDVNNDKEFHYPLMLCEVRTGKIIKILEDYDGAIVACAFSSDDELLLIYAINGIIRIYDIGKDCYVVTMKDPEFNEVDPIYKCELFDNDKMLIILTMKHIRILDLDWCRKHHQLKSRQNVPT